MLNDSNVVRYLLIDRRDLMGLNLYLGHVGDENRYEIVVITPNDLWKIKSYQDDIRTALEKK